jgi:hypothetical protein
MSVGLGARDDGYAPEERARADHDQAGKLGSDHPLPQSAQLGTRRRRQDLPHDNKRARTDQQASCDGDATSIGHSVSAANLAVSGRHRHLHADDAKDTNGRILDKAYESAY